jgi:uracil-DNA glycosylase
MDGSQFSQGLLQLMRHFDLAGWKHFSTTTAAEIPEGWLQPWLPEAGRGAAAQTAAGVGNIAAPSAAIATAVPAGSASGGVAGRATPGTKIIGGNWELPQLPVAEREAQLAAVNAEVVACRRCTDIVCYRRRTVLGEGHLQPKVCFFGEAPGADEDEQGRPFVGAAGQLLDKIIGAMRLRREEVYILNALKCRPPQNRTPLPDEIEHCRGYALRQLDILQPEYLILLGSVAVRSVLNSTESIGRLRGRFHQFKQSKVLVTYHPAYLLRAPDAKKLVWEDVQLVMRAMQEQG